MRTNTRSIFNKLLPSEHANRRRRWRKLRDPPHRAPRCPLGRLVRRPQPQAWQRQHARAPSPVDQSALHGLLSRVRELGVPLIAVTQIDGASSLAFALLPAAPAPLAAVPVGQVWRGSPMRCGLNGEGGPRTRSLPTSVPVRARHQPRKVRWSVSGVKSGRRFACPVRSTSSASMGPGNGMNGSACLLMLAKARSRSAGEMPWTCSTSATAVSGS